MSRIACINVENIEGAFDLATTAPYAFAARVLEHPDEVYVLRFAFSGRGAERLWNQMEYFLQHGRGFPDKCVCYITPFSGTRRAPGGKAHHAYAIDIVVLHRESDKFAERRSHLGLQAMQHTSPSYEALTPGNAREVLDAYMASGVNPFLGS